jgi:hypothetical protein
MPLIKLMNNTTNFADCQIDAVNVGGFRGEKNIPADSTVNVNGVIAKDSTIFKDTTDPDKADHVAVVTEDKTGG